MMWNTVLIAFAVIWLIALIDSFRRDRFPPLLGSERAGKYAWRLSFLLCNPLLAVLYLLLVPRRLLAKQAQLRDLLVVLSLLLVVSLHLEIWGQESARRFTLQPGGELPGGSSIGLAMRTSNLNNSSSTASYLHPDAHPVPQRTIQIRSDSRHPIITMAARRLAQRLVSLPFVEQVEFLPAGELPALDNQTPGNRAPDLYLTLAANLESWSLPFYGRANVAVLAHLSNTPVLPVGNSIEAPEGVAATCMLTGSMQLTYNRFGLALGVAAYEEVANSIADSFGSAAESKLQAAHDIGGTLPDLPAAFAFRETPKIANLGTADESTHGWFLHNRSLWRLNDARPANVVIDALAAELRQSSWTEQRRDGNGDATKVTFARGDEQLKMHRQRQIKDDISWPFRMHSQLEPAQPEVPASDLPILVTYENPFSDAEVNAIANELLATENADPHWLLLLLDRATPKQRASFRTAIRASTANGTALSSSNWFKLAQHAHQDDSNDEAIQATENAWLLCRLGIAAKSNEAPIAEFATLLGIELPPITSASLASLGLTVLERDIDTTVSCRTGQSRLFACIKGGQPGSLRIQLTRAQDGVVEIARHFAKDRTSWTWTEVIAADSTGAFESRQNKFLQGIKVEVRGRLLDDDHVELTLCRRH
ncbi:MAG: hypothetical protein ACI9SE_000116 [Neolewinella sp.]|jgi:hypothetical protein